MAAQTAAERAKSIAAGSMTAEVIGAGAFSIDAVGTAAAILAELLNFGGSTLALGPAVGSAASGGSAVAASEVGISLALYALTAAQAAKATGQRLLNTSKGALQSAEAALSSCQACNQSSSGSPGDPSSLSGLRRRPTEDSLSRIACEIKLNKINRKASIKPRSRAIRFVKSSRMRILSFPLLQVFRTLDRHCWAVASLIS